MNQLSRNQYEKAKSSIKSKARSLERSIFEYEFESAPVSIVYHELAKYQNEDGGFGNGVEPDLRSPLSSALGTMTAFQYIARLKDMGMIQKAI
jgi:hypothetical protein